MHILVLIRQPYLDKIPSLKTLLWYLSQKSYQVTVISSSEYKYPSPTFDNNNIKFIFVKKRSKKIELPTTIKLGWEFIKYSLSQKPIYCIGGDTFGNILLSTLNKVFGFKHIYFLLEYPQIITEKHDRLSKTDRKEWKVLQKAFLVITHDDFHKKFLTDEIKLNANKILTLPNATFTEIVDYTSKTLRELFGISVNKKIILHSGGLGAWFRCKELAESTKNWPDDTVLIFHTSHDVSGDNYFETLRNTYYNDKVFFSIKPVPTFELDSLVCSANIGIALYSVKLLEYRAEFMGFAAGKIGNYLKCGLPVIATKLFSFTYLENYHCGILINSEDEISDAINIITKNYEEYSKNARVCYQALWYPEKFVNEIIRVMEDKTSFYPSRIL